MSLEETGLREPSGHREDRRQGTGAGFCETVTISPWTPESPISPLRLLSQGTGLWGAWSKLSYLLELHSPPWGTVLLRKQACVDIHRSINEF